MMGASSIYIAKKTLMNSEVSNKKFFDTIGVYVDNKIPFVVYRMPRSKVLCFKTGHTSFGRLKMK